MGFIRQQEENLAARLLAWQCEKQNRPVPPGPELRRKAAQLVDDAHRIAHKRGKNVLSIIKEMASDLMKKK